MQMNTIGFGTGMVAGGMAALAVGAGNAAANAIQNHRIEAAFARWDEALRRERAARRHAEQRVLALRAEVDALRGKLAMAQIEAKLLRAA